MTTILCSPLKLLTHPPNKRSQIDSELTFIFLSTKLMIQLKLQQNKYYTLDQESAITSMDLKTILKIWFMTTLHPDTSLSSLTCLWWCRFSISLMPEKFKMKLTSLREYLKIWLLFWLLSPSFSYRQFWLPMEDLQWSAIFSIKMEFQEAVWLSNNGWLASL